MNIIPTAPSGKKLQFPLQPAAGWIAILALGLITVVIAVAGLGKLLNYLFPLGAVAVGLLLYFRYPLLYVGFTWWIWFLAAFVRRVADYRGGGFTAPSPIILTPYLVTLITLITLYHHLPKTYRWGGLPFILASTGVIYGFLIGWVNKSLPAASTTVVDWLAPIPFGFHLFIHWRDYPDWRRNLERTFLWGVLVMGTYGLIQHLSPPAWERFWLDNSQMVSADFFQGSDKLRVWSTMGYSEQFGAVITAGLILLLINKSPLVFPAGVVGYLSLLLSMLRSAYVGWIAGFLTFMGSSLKPKVQRRLMITVLIMAACVIPLATTETFNEIISDRVGTLSDVENDNSARGRKETFFSVIDSAILNVLGNGLGGGGHDNSVLSLLLDLGWLGTLPYVTGLLLITLQLFRRNASKVDPLIAACRAIVMSCLIRFPVNGVVYGPSNMVLWSFLAYGIVALKYHQNQSSLDSGPYSDSNLSMKQQKQIPMPASTEIPTSIYPPT